jgi:hypothetical protein
MGIGHLREKRGAVVLRSNMFFSAFSFAFGVALIRLVYIQVQRVKT